MLDARKGVLGWPFVRGVTTLVEALRLGSQALRFSADHYEVDLEAQEQAAAAGGANPTATKPGSAGPLAMLTMAVTTLATLDADPSPGPVMPSAARKRSPFTWVALVIALLLFVALPQAVAFVASRLFHVTPDIRSPGFQALTGLFKLAIVVGYMLVIRRVAEIRRVFQFHGAEHKTIATWEATQELSVANARSKSKLHPRCGTTFLVMVVFVSILVFTAIGPLLPRVPLGGALAENVLFFLMKLPFLPVIAAITYELQRLSARFCLTGPLRAALYPGFAVQMITTIEPDDSQLEVALAALRATLWRERATQAHGADQPSDRSFASFSELMAQPDYGPAAPPSSHASA